MAIISDKLNKILSAVFGKDVRQALHDGLDAINKETESTTSRQDYLDRKYDEQIKNMTLQDPSSAEIVDMRVAANGTTFEKAGDRLNYFDEQLDTKANETDLQLQKIRIDSFTRLEEGSTTGDAELTDSRIASDGTVYPTLGEAIRGQIKTLDFSIFNLNNLLRLTSILKLTFQIGDVHKNGEINTNNRYSIVSNKFSIKSKNITILNSSNGNDVGFSIVKYSEDNTTEKIGVFYNKEVILENDSKEYRIIITNGTQLNDTLLEKNFKFYDGIINQSRIDEIETDIKILQTDCNTLELSKDYYVLKNGDIKIPYSSFINAELKSEYKNLKSSGYWWTHHFKDYYIYKNNQHDSYVDFTLYNDNLSKVVSKKRLNIKVANTNDINPTTPKNLLILGDSFIQSGGIVDVIVNKFNELGLSNINFVGSYTDTDTQSGNRYEGHGGYRAYDFITNPKNLRPEFPRNPFWNPTSNKIDFKYYCDNVIHENGLDYVYIHLGVNDKLTDSLTYDKNNIIVDRLITLINYIHESYAQCKILVDGLVPISEDCQYKNYYYYREDIFDYNNKLEQALSIIKNVYYVPSILNFNSKYAYKYENEKVYDNSDETVKIVKEWLHPNLTGYKMIADMFIPAFIYNCLM